MMLRVHATLAIDEDAIEYSAIRAQGAGGQKVNKTASAIQLRFDIHAAGLDEATRQRLLQYPDQRITNDGVIVIKAQEFRSQEQNRLAARQRLLELLRSATHRNKPRRPTRPSRRAKRKRLDAKTRRGSLKRQRRGPELD